MMHYQIYKALADERTNELVAAAKRHERIVVARHNSTDASGSSSRPKDIGTKLMTLLHLRHHVPARPAVTSERGAISRPTVTPARGGSTITSASSAGPIGCSA